MIEIRPITELNDQLVNEIFMLKQELSPNHTINPSQYGAALRNPSTVVIGAKDGVNLVGIAVVNIVETLSTRIGDIDDVVVLTSYHGQGIAKRLLDEIMAVAKAKHVGLLRLTSAPKREAANCLYTNYGFKQKDTNSYRYFLK